MTRLSAGERGQVTVLAMGLCVVCFATGGLAVDGARVWILRRSLQAAADAAAASGASALDTVAYHESDGTTRRLDPELARSEAAAVLAARGLPGRFEISATAAVVRTRLRTSVPTSFLALVGIRDLPVVADATARPFFGDP